MRRGAKALAARAAAGRGALLAAAGVPVEDSLRIGPGPDAGPLDLVALEDTLQGLGLGLLTEDLSGGGGGGGEGGARTTRSPAEYEGAVWETALELGVRVVRGEACGAAVPGSMRVCWGAASSDEEAREAGSRLGRAYRAHAHVERG